MDQFVVRANIDQYLNLLHNGRTSAEDRSAINRLLVAELDKLDPGVARLDFAESRAASCQRRLDQICHWRNGFTDGSAERAQADKLVEQFGSTLQILAGFCNPMSRSRT